MTGQEAVRLIAVGDLSFNGHYHALLTADEGDHLLAAVTPSWQSADLRLGNLESPITTAARAAASKLALRAPPGAANLLRRAGFDCLSLANNHALDFGPDGLNETITALHACGLATLGAGAQERAARAPLVLHRRGQRIGLLAWCAVEQKSPLFAAPGTPGVAALHIEECVQEMQALRSQVDWLIVQLHWGQELAQLPSPEQRTWARRLVEAGADLVLGHHPHVLQPMERIHGVPVFYSLGNFLFSGMFWRGRTMQGERFAARYRLHPLSRCTGWVEATLRRGQSVEVRFHPARLRHDLSVVPQNTAKRLRSWDALCGRLAAPSYAAAYAAEVRQAAARLRWQAAWQSPLRRFELWLFRHGLMPFAVEGR